MSITQFLAGFIAVGALGLGAAGAQESANGPDAGIGIPGYNVPYEHSASGLGPGGGSYTPPGYGSYSPRHHRRYRKYAHNYHRWY